MSATLIPTSLSLYRGQADKGIGEPGVDIRRGEQYIAADPTLAGDASLLRLVRDWLTLDSTPADHGRAGGRLTGWAAFPLGPNLFVVRLGNAGKFDGRDAYFAHARVWQIAALPADADPGLYLGIDQCFAESAERIGDPAPGESPAPSPAPMEPILAHKDLAISLSAHLIHAMHSGVPLIIAVPIAEFGGASMLPRLIAFARGALPVRLRRRCRVRIFSRSPQRLLDPSNGPGGVDLLVIPNDQTVRDALSAAGRSALLLDEYGERRQGSAPADGLLDYARNLLDSAQRFPDQLTAVTNRFDLLWPDEGKPPTPTQTDWTTLTYNLTVALAGSEGQRGSLFANYLLAQARANPKVPWSRLVRPEDWARFPREHLIRFILRADDDLSPGERALQGLLARVFQQRGETLDSGLSSWWSPTDPAKRRRLLELCEPEPPLISVAASTALTAPLSIDELAAGGAPITGALRAEYRQGLLGRRRRDADRLLGLLDQPGLFALLDQAAREDVLPAPWQGDSLDAMPVPQTVALTRQLLRAADGQTETVEPGLISRLLERLHAQPTGLEAIADDLRNAAYRIDVAKNPERYLDMADALLRTRPGSAEELRGRLWEETEGLTSVDNPSGLLNAIIDDRWSVVGADDLLGQRDGTLNVTPTPELATVLLESETVAGRICADDLMVLGGLLPIHSERAISAYHTRVDALMQADTQPTTDLLIEHGAWLTWRRHAEQRLDAKERHRHAMDWLTSANLAAYRTESARNLPPQWSRQNEQEKRTQGIDITFETWKQVIDDLQLLTHTEIDRLTTAETHWPWLYPSSLRQVGSIAARCIDLDALALLTERISKQLEMAQDRLAAKLWKQSPHRDRWPGDPLGWLLGDATSPPLDLDTAKRLAGESRAYKKRAERALVRAIIAALQTDLADAVTTIDALSGWSHRDLRAALRQLLLDTPPEGKLLRRIELGLEQDNRSRPRAPTTDPEAPTALEEHARKYYEKGYRAIPELLSPGLATREAKRRWPEQVIDALVEREPKDTAFDLLRDRVRAAVRSRTCRASDHPLTILLQQINRLPQRGPERAKLRMYGWQHLRAVVEQDEAFFHWAELHKGDLVLPLFRLAISLQPQGSSQAGALAQCFMTVPICRELRTHERWWRALLSSVLDQTDPSHTDPSHIRRESSAQTGLHWAEQTRNATLGLIYSQIADLSEDEMSKFDAAWHRLNISGIWNPGGDLIL